MLLTDSTAVARQVLTPIRPKSSTRKTACLDLTSGPRPLQGTGKHVVKSLHYSNSLNIYFNSHRFRAHFPSPAFLFRRKSSMGQPSQHLLPSRAMSLRQQHLLPPPLSLPLSPTLPHPSQVLLRGRGLELRQADSPRLSSGR